MSDLKRLIAEGQRLLAEAKPEVKSVEVTHFPQEDESPGLHKTSVKYAHGKNIHYYELSTLEQPKKAGWHTVHKVTPDGEPIEGDEGEPETLIHNQAVLRKDFQTHGGRKVHQLLVKNFTDRLHPSAPKQQSLIPKEPSK